ncbi:hypothetical protein EJ03DRAFT_381377 [Teratosphaeria nubilosa]|uniref:Uncharacterized protein n=1 Tax=Teratosphaeria nubilosa TaxID=161662 RepID=A0A6G1LF82_9PEZI|nr:hypothetical protein EJ03DRAFT_381377 [Teratosphaeria nubilosa]
MSRHHTARQSNDHLKKIQSLPTICTSLQQPCNFNFFPWRSAWGSWPALLRAMTMISPKRSATADSTNLCNAFILKTTMTSAALTTRGSPLQLVKIFRMATTLRLNLSRKTKLARMLRGSGTINTGGFATPISLLLVTTLGVVCRGTALMAQTLGTH